MNDAIFYFFYSLAHYSKFYDYVITFFAVYFIYIVIISALVFSFLYRKSWRDLALVLFSGGAAWFVSKFIAKLIFHTDRPFVMFSQVQSLFPETGFAFPSGHTTVAAAIAFAVFFINKKVGYLFLLFALDIGLARIAAGVHFPIDILGGFVLGALISFAVAYFVKKYNMSI